jgi:hypothetical protein
MKTLSPTRPESKSATSAEIKQQIAAYEKSGGKIQQVPDGALKGWVNLTRQYPERGGV